MKLWYLDKVHIVDYYDDWEVRTSTTSFKVPSVVSVHSYIPRKTKINCTRTNIFVRDNFTCQYCGKAFARKHLTIDHVIPSSKGGPFTWENLVAACYKCNNKKSDKIIKPLNTPFAPNYYQMVKQLLL